jgi:hypothetical protein
MHSGLLRKNKGGGYIVKEKEDEIVATENKTKNVKVEGEQKKGRME